MADFRCDNGSTQAVGPSSFAARYISPRTVAEWNRARSRNGTAHGRAMEPRTVAIRNSCGMAPTANHAALKQRKVSPMLQIGTPRIFLIEWLWCKLFVRNDLATFIERICSDGAQLRHSGTPCANGDVQHIGPNRSSSVQLRSALVPSRCAPPVIIPLLSGPIPPPEIEHAIQPRRAQSCSSPLSGCGARAGWAAALA